MTKIQEHLRTTLAKLPAFGIGSHLLEAADGDRSLRCDLVALDTLACAFERLVVQDRALGGASVDRLKQVAEKLSQRLTYLLEPISPIEVDSEGCAVQMRSSPPHQEDDRTSYYELLVNRSGELSLCRYSRVQGTGGRSTIPAQVTREVLVRLVGDFEAVLA